MSKCVFCNGLGVATTNTTTPSEAFPFLCAQLGVNPSQGPMSSAPLCATCHSLWEEVTLLYSNMQGLVNLMGRRVGQLRQKLRNDQLPDKGGKIGKRKRMATATTKEPPTEEMLNWWYPSMASGHLDLIPTTTTTTSLTSPEVNDYVNVKSEAFEEVGLVDEGGSGDEMEMEDIEIIPEDEDNGNVEESADSDDEDDGDPSYDPLASSSCNRTRTKPGSSSSTRGKTKIGPDNGTDEPNKTTMAHAVFDLIPAYTSKRKPVICKEGFAFNLKKMLVEKISWICVHNRESKCYAQLYSTKDLNNLTLLMETGTHNHPPDPAACEKRKLTSRIMLDATSSNEPVEQVVARHVAQMTAENPTGTVPKISIESIKRVIRLARGSETGEKKVTKKMQKKQVIYFSQ